MIIAIDFLWAGTFLTNQSRDHELSLCFALSLSQEYYSGVPDFNTIEG